MTYRMHRGMGYTADDAARAVTPEEKGAAADFYAANLSPGQLRLAALSTGTQQSIYTGTQYLAWLKLIAQQNWNTAQRSLITAAINNLEQNAFPLWRTQEIIGGQLLKAAGLELVSQDAPMQGTTTPLSQLVERFKSDLLAQLQAWGDLAVYNQYIQDATAAKASTDAIAAATDKIVSAGGTYIPAGVTLPPQFLPATVAAAASQQQQQLASQTGGTTPPASGGNSTPSTATVPGGTPALDVSSVPSWVWILGAAGLGIAVFGGHK